MKPHIRAGRLTLWLWSGSWSWIERLDCDHCWNAYVGPFGIEWECVPSPEGT